MADRPQARGRQTAFTTVSSRSLFIAGLVLIAVGATSHEWKTHNTGSAGILEGCGCRNVNNNCNYGGGTGGNPLFKGTMCDNYNTIRSFAIISAVSLYLALTLLTYRESWFFRQGLTGTAKVIDPATELLKGGQRPRDKHESWVSFVGQVLLFVSWAAGLIATAMFGSLIRDTGTASDIEYGFWIFFAGWAFVFLFWLMYMTPWFNRYFTGREDVGVSHVLSSMAIHWLLIFALVLLAVGAASSHWAKPKVHTEHVLVPDFELVVQDIHNNTGTNRSLTTIDECAETIITPNSGVGPCDRDLTPENCPNKKMHFGLWDICLCKDIKPNCKFAGARLFKGGNCDTFETSQYFVWFTLGFAALAFMPYTFGFFRTWWLPIVGPLGMTVICGIIAAATFGSVWDQEKAHKGDVNGDGFIMFVVGVGLTLVGGAIAGWTEVEKEGTWLSGFWSWFKKRG